MAFCPKLLGNSELIQDGVAPSRILTSTPVSNSPFNAIPEKLADLAPSKDTSQRGLRETSNRICACCNVMGQCSLHKLKLDCELILLPCSPTSKVIVKRCPEPKPVISISMWLCSGAMVTLESLQQYMFKILFTLSKETGNPAFILSISYTDIQLFRVVKWSMNFWDISLYSLRTSWQKVRDKPLHISERRNVLIPGND